MEPKKLNLGCGEFPKVGYVNVDWNSAVKSDVAHDLNILPYPFPGNSFSLVEADHVLEHLTSPFAVMKEIWRVAQDQAMVIIRVPHFSRGFSHPEHKRGFDFTFPLYFQKTFKGGYQGVEFELKKMKLSWFAQKYLKKQTVPRYQYIVALILGTIYDFFANLSPVLCSRLWCFWVGGFEEIEFHLICKK